MKGMIAQQLALVNSTHLRFSTQSYTLYYTY